MTNAYSFVNQIVYHLMLTAVLLSALPPSTVTASPPNDVFKTVQGRKLSVRELQRRHPGIPSHQLAHRVFESVGNDLLVSHHSRLSISSTASRVEHVSASPSVLAVVNGVQIRDVNVRLFTTLRKGNGYTFVYANNSSLLTAWGPSLELIPLEHSGISNIFLNLHNSHVVDLSNDIISFDLDTTTRKTQPSSIRDSRVENRLSFSERSDGLEKEFSLKMPSTSDNDYFFNIAVAYDSSFCARYGNDPNKVRKVLETVVDETDQYLGYIVDTRLTTIVGFCNVEKDPLAPPPSLKWCARHNASCSPSTQLLDHFTNFWAVEAPDVLHDAVYFFSGYGDGTPVAGAAYLRSVCAFPYNVGWVETISPIILAHEMGHTLGAPHDSTGLMKPQLSIVESSVEPSAASTWSMQQYLNSLSSKECVVPKLGETQSGAQTTYFLLSEGSPHVPTDVAFAFRGKGVDASTFVLDVIRRGTRDYLSYSRGKMVPVTYDAMPRLRSRTKLRHIPTDPHGFNAGAGLAVASLSSPTATDLIYSFAIEGAGYYGIGLNIDDDGFALGGWSKSIKIPYEFGSNVSCLGMTSGRVRAGSTVDLVFTYVAGNKLFYIVGFGVDKEGNMRGGWSSRFSYPRIIEKHVGDVSVALFDIDENGSLDLIFMWTEEDAGLWNTVLSIGNTISEQGKVLGEWTSFVAERRFPRRGIRKLTGGIAISKLTPWEKPVAVFYDGISYNGSSLGGMEVGFDMIKKPTPHSKPSTIINRKTKCEICYSKSKENSCATQVQKCIEKMSENNRRAIIKNEPPSPIARNLNTGLLEKPDSSSIECTGFHHLFVKESESNCRKPVEPEDELAAGAAFSLLEELRNAVSLEGNSTSSPSNLYLVFYRSLLRKNDAGTSGQSRVPKTIVITYRSEKDLRRPVVRRALSLLKRRPDFSAYFQSGIQFPSRVVRVKDGKRVIIIKFKLKYHQEYFIQL